MAPDQSKEVYIPEAWPGGDNSLRQFSTRIPESLHLEIKRRAVGSTVQLLIEEALELYFRGGYPLSRVDELLLRPKDVGPTDIYPGPTRPFSVKLPHRVVYDMNLVAAMSDRSVAEVFYLALREYVASGRTPPRKADARRGTDGRLMLPPIPEKEAIALAQRGSAPSFLGRERGATDYSKTSSNAAVDLLTKPSSPRPRSQRSKVLGRRAQRRAPRSRGC